MAEWTVGQALQEGALADAEVAAGETGLSRALTRLVPLADLTPDAIAIQPGDALLLWEVPPEALSADRIAGLARDGCAALILIGRPTAVPPTVRAAAEALAFPILMVPDAVAWARLISAVTEARLARESRSLRQVVAFEDRLRQAFLSQGAQGMVDRLSDWVRGPVLLAEAEGELIAASGAWEAHAGAPAAEAIRNALGQPGIRAEAAERYRLSGQVTVLRLTTHSSQLWLYPIMAGTTVLGWWLWARIGEDAGARVALEPAATVGAMILHERVARPPSATPWPIAPWRAPVRGKRLESRGGHHALAGQTEHRGFGPGRGGAGDRWRRRSLFGEADGPGRPRTPRPDSTARSG